MNNQTLKTTPTVQLIDILTKAEKEGNQDLVNIVAWELAFRIYVPNPETTIGEMAVEFGYKEPEEKILGRRI